ncbi:MAG: ADP-ribosylglycohydrolase family protein [Acholeplasmatales bacterium]|nr:ADP-ribosylglycohydrolase family protein [Acholeplasmatales bacterium]
MLGAIIGDIVGSIYEFNNIRTMKFPLFTDKNFFTDDTVMTLAVAEILQNGYVNDNDKVIDTLKKWGRAYPDSGYGGRFYQWLFGPSRNAYGSFGNGSAMRVSACGWYGNSEEEVKDLATKVTIVTHNHPEGLKGAIVVAICIYYARIGKSKAFIKDYIEKFYDVDFSYEELRKNYKFSATCQDSVPEALYCFLISDSFEETIRTTISIGGDCDTTSAIAGAIAEAFFGIPDNIKEEALKRLPKEIYGCNAKQIIDRFINDFK